MPAKSAIVEAPSVGARTDDDPHFAAALSLVRRMGEQGLLARPDPIDECRYMLIRRRAGASLGAGQAASAVVQAALDRGLLTRRADGLLTVAEAGPTPLERPAPAAAPRLNERESPLAWLRRRRSSDGTMFLSDEAFLAGERFRSDVTAACLMPNVTTNWERVETSSAPGGARGAAEASDRTVAARRRVRSVFAALGPETGNFLFDVCGFLTPLGEAERQRRWPARSGKLVLRLALTQLAAHYGIAGEAHGPGRASIERWVAPGGAADADQWL